jgi:HEAT repeat protein/GTPase SAR1 family protein
MDNENEDAHENTEDEANEIPSGHSSGPTAIGKQSEATDLRHSTGAVYKPQGDVYQTTTVNIFHNDSQSSQQSDQDLTKLLHEYRKSLIRRYSTLDLRQLSWLEKLSPSLKRVYIGLHVVDQSSADDISSNAITRTTQQEQDRPDREKRPSHLRSLTRPMPIKIALEQSNHLVILGEAGSGKTTLLHYLVLEYTDQQANDNLELKTDRLPIYLKLNDYAEAVKRKPSPSLADFIIETLAKAITTLPGSYVRETLRQGGCLLLLDGLDEASNKLRGDVVEQIDDFLSDSNYGKNQLVITSRITGYRTFRLRSKNVVTYTLHPFQPREIKEYTRKWFQAVADANDNLYPDGEAERQADHFLEAAQRSGIIQLLQNPLLLHLAVVVFSRNEMLPQSRTKLYNEYLEPILFRRAEIRAATNPPDSSIQLKRALAKIAWLIHSKGPQRREQILSTLERTDDGDIGISNSDAVFDYLYGQSGLLADTDEGSHDFIHLTFREYFVAYYLAHCWQTNETATWQLFSSVRHQADMHQPILFLAGLLAEETGGATSLIRNLLETAPHPRNIPVRIFPTASRLGLRILQRYPNWQRTARLENYLHRDLILAAHCLAETQSVGVDQKIAQSLVKSVLEVWNSNPFDRKREEILQVMKAIIDDVHRKSIVSVLVNNLSDANSSIRWTAAYALGEIGDASDFVIEALIRSLSDSQIKSGFYQWGSKPWDVGFGVIHDVGIEVRLNAAYSLGRLKNDTPAVIEALSRTMREDERSGVRQTAAASLAHLSTTNPEGVRILIETLFAEPPETTTSLELNYVIQKNYQETRQIAAYGLSQLDYASPQVRDLLLENLDCTDPFIRQSVAVALARSNPEDEPVDEKVIRALASGSGIRRFGSAESNTLVKLAQTNPQAMRILKSVILQNPNGSGALLYDIRRMEQLSSELIPVLIKAATEPYSATRDNAIEALGKLGLATPEVVDTLVHSLKPDYDPGDYIRRAAAVSLGQLGYSSDEVIAALIDDIEEGFPGAVTSLGKLGRATPEVIAALNQAMTYHSHGIRDATAISLIQLDQVTPEIIEHLISRLRTKPKAWRTSEISTTRGLVWSPVKVLVEILKRLKYSITRTDERQELAERAVRSMLEKDNSGDLDRRKASIAQCLGALDLRMLEGQEPQKIEAVFDALSVAISQDGNYPEVFEAASQSLVQLSKYQRDQIINILLNLLANPRLDKRSTRIGLGRTIHNYVYDALTFIMQNESRN